VPAKEWPAMPDNFSKGPLSDLRVLDLSDDLGAYAGRMFGDLGAEVYWIEPPSGAKIRSKYDLNETVDADSTAEFLHYGVNKKSAAIDIHTEYGREALLEAVKQSDIFIETGDPGEFDTLGIGYDSLRKANPGLIYLTITPYGQTGPHHNWKGTALTGAASGGLMYLCGDPDLPPMQPSNDQAYQIASLVAVSTSLVALFGREHRGRLGSRVDISVQEATSMTTLQTASANAYTWYHRIPSRSGLDHNGRRHLYECADGKWISFVVPEYRWAEFTQWLVDENIGDTLLDPSWTDFSYRMENYSTFSQVVETFCRRFSRDALYEEGQRRRLLTSPVAQLDELTDHQQLTSRDFFESLPTGKKGRKHRFMRPPYKFSSTPLSPLAPPPELASHNNEFLQLSRTPSTHNPSDPKFPLEARPLTGITVCDFSWMIAGPSVSRLLSDWGAQVIRVESSTRMCQIRQAGLWPPDSQKSGDSPNAVFSDCNLGKKSVTLNLNDERGRDLAKKLIQQSDVLLNNFTGSRMARWGMAFDDLKDLNTGLVMLSMPVMGSSGPMKDFRANGNGVLTATGINYGMGEEGTAPIGMGPLYSDFSAPYFGASAILSALHHRLKEGEGQFIDLSQFESTLNLLGPLFMETELNGIPPARPGNGHRRHTPQGVFRCTGKDRWVAISVTNDREWVDMCRALDGDRGDEYGSRFPTSSNRRQHEYEISEWISSRVKDWDAWNLTNHLQEYSVPASVVQSVQDFVELDPHLSTQHFADVSDRAGGVTYRSHLQPARINAEVPIPGRAPTLGEHNEEVLVGMLGLTQNEFVQFVVDGVIA
jgi:crotonobetainyl-CoA:carnitine CoA-transferase CaiB-like acyl-CoA transferase